MDASSPNRTYCAWGGFPCRARRYLVRFDTMRGGIGLVVRRYASGGELFDHIVQRVQPPLPTHLPTCPPTYPPTCPRTCPHLHGWATGVQHWASPDRRRRGGSIIRARQAVASSAAGATQCNMVRHAATRTRWYAIVHDRASCPRARRGGSSSRSSPASTTAIRPAWHWPSMALH